MRDSYFITNSHFPHLLYEFLECSGLGDEEYGSRMLGKIGTT